MHLQSKPSPAAYSQALAERCHGDRHPFDLEEARQGDARLETIVRLLFAAAIVLAGALSWMSYRFQDPLAAAFFFMLMVALAACGRILTVTSDPSNVVDLEDRRRQLASVATSEYGKAARRG